MQLAFSPDGKSIAAGSNGGMIHWWDAATGQKKHKDLYPFLETWGLRFRRDGELLVDGCKSGVLCRYEWSTKKELYRSPSWMLATTRTPLPSPDGRMLATIEEGKAIHLWETSTRQLRLRFVSTSKEDLESLAFSSDGRRLASGCADGTVLVWDAMGTTDDAIKQLREDLDSCWLKLSGQGGGEAYRAIRALASVPEKAVPFLDRSLRGTNEKTQVIVKLIADLDHPRFPVREKAMKELLDLGPLVRTHLENALEGKLSLEARRRIEGLLSKLPKEVLPQLIRDLRALEALERIGTPEARAVLKRLAGGEAETRLTREAKAALDRHAD